MPRFYFHLRNDLDADDEEGIELPGVEAARRKAVDYALDMSAASILEHHRVNLRHSIQVANEAGRIVSVVEFGDVITVEK